VNLLLDTHIALWAITDSPRLTPQARELLLAPHAQLWVSAASLWEISGSPSPAHVRTGSRQIKC